MKPKELSAKTGLKERTIRFYEEKGLLAPKKVYRNGREYRDYTEEDVRTLLVVASLRRAWFTLEEIRRMQQDPAAIQEIFPRYREWLLAQKSQLDGLLAAAEQIEPENVASVEELSARMAAETEKLPLPWMDRKPRFKYLDELEERLPQEADEQQKQRERLQAGKAWTWRRMALYASKAPVVDYSFQLGLLRETRDLVRQGNDGPAQREPVEQGPRWLRWSKGLLTLTAALFAVICMVRMLGGMFPLRLWALFLTTAGARLLWAYLEH